MMVQGALGENGGEEITLSLRKYMTNQLLIVVKPGGVLDGGCQGARAPLENDF